MAGKIRDLGRNAAFRMSANYYYDQRIDGNPITDYEILDCELGWNSITNPDIEPFNANKNLSYGYTFNLSDKTVDFTDVKSIRQKQYSITTGRYVDNFVFQTPLKFKNSNIKGISAVMGGTIGTNFADGDLFDLSSITCRFRKVGTSQTSLNIRRFDPGQYRYRIVPVLPDPIDVYRYYNSSTGRHFYTTSPERMADYPQFKREKKAFSVYPSNPINHNLLTPVYRFYNAKTQAHLYVSDEAQAERIRNNYPDFRDEGIKFYALVQNTTYGSPINRYFNPTTNAHFFTADPAEKLAMANRFSKEFKFEGSPFRVYMGL